MDNASDGRHVLQTIYPALYASLGQGAATLAPRSHVQGEDLQRLRQAIALQIGGSRIGGRPLVTGPAGPLALLDRAPDGRIMQVHLVFAKSGGEYERVALPEGATNVRRVVARGPSLFVEKEVTAWTSSTPHPFFVRPAAGQDWQVRYKPQASCGLLEFQDDAGQQLRTRCNGTLHVSSDGGVSWR